MYIYIDIYIYRYIYIYCVLYNISTKHIYRITNRRLSRLSGLGAFVRCRLRLRFDLEIRLGISMRRCGLHGQPCWSMFYVGWTRWVLGKFRMLQCMSWMPRKKSLAQGFNGQDCFLAGPNWVNGKWFLQIIRVSLVIYHSTGTWRDIAICEKLCKDWYGEVFTDIVRWRWATVSATS